MIARDGVDPQLYPAPDPSTELAHDPADNPVLKQSPREEFKTTQINEDLGVMSKFHRTTRRFASAWRAPDCAIAWLSHAIHRDRGRSRSSFDVLTNVQLTFF